MVKRFGSACTDLGCGGRTWTLYGKGFDRLTGLIVEHSSNNFTHVRLITGLPDWGHLLTFILAFHREGIRCHNCALSRPTNRYRLRKNRRYPIMPGCACWFARCFLPCLVGRECNVNNRVSHCRLNLGRSPS